VPCDAMQCLRLSLAGLQFSYPSCGILHTVQSDNTGRELVNLIRASALVCTNFVV
jgi:hypothetical protein